MKLSKRFFTVLLVVLCSVALLPGTAGAFSGGSGGGVEGEPPNGLAISEFAHGIKLTGVLFVEYINHHWDGGQDYAEMARVVLRLKKGKILKIFYDEIRETMSPEVYPLETQLAIMEKMEADVIAAFFPSETDLEAKVKLMVNFMTIDGGSFLPRHLLPEPYIGTCDKVWVCTEPGDPACDSGPQKPPLWIEIDSCDSDYELCGNGIDDDGDLLWDTEIEAYKDPDCDETLDLYKRSAYSVTDIDLAIK